MRVEKLTNNGQGRILVQFEGGESLRITEEELLRFDLCTGLDIAPAVVVELRQSAARSETRRRAAEMVSARPLSKRELRKRLQRKGAAEQDAGDAADWLEEIGAVDDRAYAALLVRHYSARGYGEAKLRDELLRRGVPRALWEEALAGAPPAEQTLMKLLRAKHIELPMDEKERRRLSGQLLRRGFSWQEIRAALSLLGEELPEE